MSEPALDQRLVVLREELKVWEKDFANANGGRKAGRDNIKAEPTIAQKYKEYSRLRDPPKTRPAQQTPKKRKSSSHQFETPRKKAPKIDAEGKALASGAQAENHDAHPLQPEATTPAKSPQCLAIGPTPQKDGMVLGLFDNVPSTTPRRESRTALGDIPLNIAQTPSRTVNQTRDQTPQTCRKLSRTPLSTGKRFLLDTFTTPSKRKLDDEGTPSSAKRLATPAFLRRCPRTLDTVAEEQQDVEVARPWQRRSFGRSLSSMIQEMRRKEDNQFEDEMEAMREMENEAPMATSQTGSRDQPPSGPALEHAEDVAAAEFRPESSDQRDNQEQPRVWKKKGLKRQTKRVIMRPVRMMASKKNTQLPLHSDSEDEEEELHDDSRGKSCEEYGSLEEDSDSADKKQKGKRPPKTCKKKEQNQSAKQKINPNATAHANFRSLKIKNKNSKAKGRGMFRRGR